MDNELIFPEYPPPLYDTTSQDADEKGERPDLIPGSVHLHVPTYRCCSIRFTGIGNGDYQMGLSISSAKQLYEEVQYNRRGLQDAGDCYSGK